MYNVIVELYSIETANVTRMDVEYDEAPILLLLIVVLNLSLVTLG